MGLLWKIRHHFTWILSGAKVPVKAKKIEITIANIKLRIRIPKHETHSNQYIKNVDHFLQLQREDELPMGGLGLQSTTSTADQSEAVTPRLQLQVPIYIDQETLGTGYSSVVRRVWNVSTGISLDALTAVHEDGIVHRDVKPENILIQSRNPLRIKLSDFGLSKASLDLQTFCGTHEYAAPEIYPTGRPSTSYTEACDIWSLGVVVFEYAYGPLPRLRKKDIGAPWCQRIVNLLHDWDSDALVDLLSSAMTVNPSVRGLLQNPPMHERGQCRRHHHRYLGGESLNARKNRRQLVPFILSALEMRVLPTALLKLVDLVLLRTNIK
ncbi:MAG: hypothetical protein LQ341_003533 [Variospora aurantia]|nr:MAG: hypothetical protein LQ341_003533 [Variospora aurantia]